MKKKILAVIAAGLICVSVAGCEDISYQEAINNMSDSNNEFCGNYFTTLIEWAGGGGKCRIVYANDTKVKYFISTSGYHFGITPLYNADSTVQIYDGE